MEDETVDDMEVVREIGGVKDDPGVEVPEDLFEAPNMDRSDATLEAVSSSTGRDADETRGGPWLDDAFSELVSFDEAATGGFEDLDGGGGGGAFLTTAGGLETLTSGRGVEADPFRVREGLGGERFGVGGK